MRNKPASDQAADSPGPPHEVAEYIASLSTGLAGLARNADLKTIAALLEVTRREAIAASRKIRAANGSRLEAHGHA